MIERTLSRSRDDRNQADFRANAEDLARLVQVGDLIKASQLVLLCRVRKSVTTSRQWVTNLADYLWAKA